METANHQQGRPSWAELMTTDPTAATSFYGGLFGWTDDARPIPESDESYHMQMLQGVPVSAIAKLRPEQASMGMPPAWGVYLAVDDVDATVAKVEGAGGKVMLPPMDVMEQGRMAVLVDPTGAVVSLWQARAHQGFGRMNEHGAVTWMELVTDDVPKATAFYRALLGVETQTMPMPEAGFDYTVMGPTGNEGTGVMPKMPQMGEMPNVWAVYFEVDDADAAAARARALGGEVVQEPMDTPPAGRIAMIRDPQGAVFGVIKSMAPPAG